MESDFPRSDDELERDLMLRAKGDDAEAFNELVQRHESRLRSFFSRLGAREDEAEDAFQDTFLRLFAQRGRYEATASFRAFLFTVAKRAWIDIVRRRERRRRNLGSESLHDQIESEASPWSAEERMDLHAGLAALPEGQRMALLLSTLGGLDYKEVGQVLEIPEGTVKSRVFHALRKLREACDVARELKKRS